MAVFTHLTAQDVAAFLQNYDLGDYRDHKGIMQGVENTNFHLWTTKGRYILTVFEARIDRDSLPFVFNLQDHLAARGLRCPSVIADQSGLKTGRVKGKPFSIVSFLPGESLHETRLQPEHAKAAGAMLARMHLSSHDFPMDRQNPVFLAGWRELYDKVRNKLDVDADSLITEAFQAVDAIESLPLSRGVIHADYFPDNVFFDSDGHVCGLIDFYFACTGFFAYDLAIALNAWPHEEAFLNGYEGVMPLDDETRGYLGMLRRAGALRILMTRLYDWYYTPDDAEITPKNPQDYLEKLRELS